MPATVERWIIVELRNGAIYNLRVDASVTRDTVGEWLPYSRKLMTAELTTACHKERGLVTPHNAQGQPTSAFGPTLPPIEGQRIYDEERALRVSDIVDWSESTERWNGACEVALEQDTKAWDSALKKQRILTANASALDQINKKNGVPRLRMEP